MALRSNLPELNPMTDNCRSQSSICFISVLYGLVGCRDSSSSSSLSTDYRALHNVSSHFSRAFVRTSSYESLMFS